MERKERIVLEPSEVALPGRVEIDIHKDAILVGENGPDWGDYEVNLVMAQREMGAVAVDEEVPNRTIEIPLLLGATGDFDAARIALQAWAANVTHRGGGHLKREIVGGSYGEAGTKLFSDCVKATLKLSGGTPQARDGLDPDAVLTIEALPDFYGDRIELDPFEGAGEAAETFQIKGNLPGRAEIFVEEKSGKNQLALPWHFRCRDYSAEAPWAINVSTFERFGSAAEATVSGSISSKVVQRSALGTNWIPIAAKTIEHTGLYEVLVRCYTTSEVPPEVRLLYDVGDLVNPSETTATQIPGRNGFYLVSLGLMNLEELPIGTHTARVMLQARGASGGENVSFDRIWFLSATESSGTPTAPRRVTEGLAPPLTYDGFNQGVSGPITGKSPGVGSAYTVAPNSDTSDFEIVLADKAQLSRTSTADTGTILPPFGLGRGIGAGTAKLANHGVAHDIVSLPFQSVQTGYLLRWVDPENFLFVYVTPATGPSRWTLTVIKYKAKVLAPLAVKVIKTSHLPLSGRLEATVYEGQLAVRFNGAEILSLEDPDLLPGGVLEEGRAYFYDAGGSGVEPRVYDNFEVWPLTFEAANYANQKAWLSHVGLYRMGPSGGAYGPMARQNSDLPRVPVSGPEERPVELAVKTSRGDLESVQDSGSADPIVVRLAYRPCWSSVPGL